MVKTITLTKGSAPGSYAIYKGYYTQYEPRERQRRDGACRALALQPRQQHDEPQKIWDCA